jgi:hypothetical protein
MEQQEESQKGREQARSRARAGQE